MTYQDCLDYLFSQLPIYQRVGKAAYKADLNNTIDLLKRLKNPERGFKSIHIAGTNGKGSVSHMLASVLQESGLKVGLYTSPHLKDFRERIKINGQEIPEDNVVDFVQGNKALVEDISPSFFEWTVALAFDYFNKEKVDVAVVETGLGGRLDSTNVLNPDLCIITNIGMDHTQFLGDSLDVIAVEKAGIVKSGVPVVIGEYLDETKPVFEHKVLEVNAPIVFAQDHEFRSYSTDLKGPYQVTNLRTVLNALNELKKLEYELDDNHLRNGLNNVVKNTGLHGRWEFISEKPGILLDMAHNVEGVKIMVDELLKLHFDTLHIVWGMVNDKSIEGILKLLPKNASYYFCKPNIPRGLDENDLALSAAEIGLNGSPYNSVSEALNEAKLQAAKNDLIFVGGSTFVVAEVIPL